MSKKPKPDDDDFEFNNVDKYALDEEWVNTDKMRGYYGDKLAKAIADRDYAKLELKLQQAEMALKIRAKPEKYGLEKATNDPVAEMVLIKTEKLAKKLIKAEHKVNRFDQAVNRLRDRGKCVGDLIYLQGMNYIGKAPKSSKDRATSRKMQNRVQE